MMENNRVWELLGKKIAGEATPEELAELIRLSRENPAVQYAQEVIASLWKERDREMTDADIAGRFSRHLDRMRAEGIDLTVPLAQENDQPVLEFSNPPRSGRIWRTAAIAMTAMVAAGLFYWIRVSPIQGTKPARLSEVSTKNGSRSKIVLPDGSQVWLNAGSRLTYANDFTSAPSREVTLSGEAFFSVVHDDAHPFIIHTRTMDIRDIGTRFNVKSYPDDPTTEATLIQGAIEISIRKNPEEKIILKPNQKITLFNGEFQLDDITAHEPLKTGKTEKAEDKDLYKISEVAPDPRAGMISDTAWMANKLVFRSEEFASLAAQLERWYDVRIDFRSRAVKQYRFTGVLENETITQALEALQITGSFKYKLENDTVVIWQ